MELKETVDLMVNPKSYGDRWVAEYYQVKIRLEMAEFLVNDYDCLPYSSNNAEKIRQNLEEKELLKDYKKTLTHLGNVLEDILRNQEIKYTPFDLLNEQKREVL